MLPVFFLLIFGILETGFALKSYTSANHATRAAARVASVAGNDLMADQQILARLATEAAGIPKSEMEYIVIWHAAGRNSTPPSGCLPGVAELPNLISQGQRASGPGSCNVYQRPAATGGAFDMAAGRAAQPPDYYFGCTGPADPQRGHKVDCNWPGFDRDVYKSPRGIGPTASCPSGNCIPDYLGVYIRLKHDTVTGIIGSSFTITDQAVALLEPQGYLTS